MRPSNEQRRAELADAAIGVVIREGLHGLSHRTVDEGANVPRGTTSNYFRSRQALFAGLFARIGERLAPDPDVHQGLSARAPSAELFADYIRDIVARLSANRDVTLALFELRLEAARRPELRGPMGEWLRANFAGDVEFNRSAGLPGGAAEIALFHYAIDGLLFDRLTTSIDPDTPTDEVVDRFVAGLLRER